MKTAILAAMVLTTMVMAGCAGLKDNFNKGFEAAEARRAEKQAAKKGAGYLGKKQLAEQPGEAKEIQAPAPAATEQILTVTCKDGSAQYAGSFMTKKFNDNTVSFSDNGILISKHDSFDGGVYSDFYYHPGIGVMIELVYVSENFAGLKKDALLRSHVHIIDSDKTGNHHGEEINFQSTYNYNKGVYDQICTDKIAEIGLSKTFIRSGYLRSMTYKDLADKDDSDTLRGYQNRSSFKNLIQKYSGEKTIKNPVAFITKLLVPATKEQFEADLLNYFQGGK